MGKWVAAEILDRALSEIAGAGRMLALNGRPESYALAATGRLAEASLAGVDFSLMNAGGGRQVVIGPKEDVPVMQEGFIDHVALVNDAEERLLYVTTCPLQLVIAGGRVNFAAWSVEIGAPV